MMKVKLHAIAVIAFTLALLSGCKKEVVFNKPPVADAGMDILQSSEKFFLKGSGKDPDGKVIGYLWSVVSDWIPPAGITITNAGLIYNAGSPDGAYFYKATRDIDVLIQLMVVDNDGAVGVDTVRLKYDPSK